MIHKLTILFCVLLLGGLFLNSCKDESPEQAETMRQAEQQVDQTVDSMDEYVQQAAKDITEQNAERELKKLQKEIDLDLRTD